MFFKKRPLNKTKDFDPRFLLSAAAIGLIMISLVVQIVFRKGDQISALSQFSFILNKGVVMLADMDGRVICSKLKEDENTDHIPVILISGTHNLSDSLNQKGAPNDFIPKPFDIDVLLSKVKDQLQ